MKDCTKKLEGRSSTRGRETKKIKVPIIHVLEKKHVCDHEIILWGNISMIHLLWHNSPPNGPPPPPGWPSSGSWTSSGRSSQWRSQSWWLEPQTAGLALLLYFWPPWKVVLKSLFWSDTCSGLEKVAASHFRTFLDGDRKLCEGISLRVEIKKMFTSSGTASSSSSARSSSTLLLGRKAS